MKNKLSTWYLRSRGIVKKFRRLMNYVYIQYKYSIYMCVSHIRIIVIVIDNSTLNIYRSRIHEMLCDVYNKRSACSHCSCLSVRQI
jgi:hypothetical protein